jgi:hypothetical protein
MLQEITFSNTDIKDAMANNGITCLQYTVVNNPQPDQTFESLEGFDMGGAMPTPQNNARITKSYHIAIPNYKVMFSTLEDAEQKIPFDNYSPTMTMLTNPDPAKSTPAVLSNFENGISVGYVNRFNVNIDGVTKTTYTWANGQSKSIQTQGIGSGVMLHDNVPVTSILGTDANTELPNIVYATEGVTYVLFIPLKLYARFDLSKCEELGVVHKFDRIIIPAGQSIDTKSFSDAQFSTICCVKGEVTIGGYTVPQMAFYELDATQSVTVTAGTQDSIIVQLIRVPTITLP